MPQISFEKFVEIMYNTTLCFIPDGVLDEEQLHKLDNMAYRFCDCQMCSNAKIIGHADGKNNTIHVSRNAIMGMAGLNTNMWSAPATLLQFVITILHEIIHVLYPDYDESETDEKTLQWLNMFDWNEFVYFVRE